MYTGFGTIISNIAILIIACERLKIVIKLADLQMIYEL